MNSTIRTGIAALAGTIALTTGGVIVAQAAVGSSPEQAKREDTTTGVVSTVDDEPTPDPDPTNDPVADPTLNSVNTVNTRVSVPAAGSAVDDLSANTVQSRQSVMSKKSVASKASVQSRKSVVSKKSVASKASVQSRKSAVSQQSSDTN